MKSEIDLHVQSLKQQCEVIADEPSSRFVSQSEGASSVVSSAVGPTSVTGEESSALQSVTNMEESEVF